MKKKLSIAFISISLIVVVIGFYERSVYRHKVSAPKTPVLQSTTFDALPGFVETDTRVSFQAFQHSCRTFLRQDPEANAGTAWIPLKVRDWQAVCRHAIGINSQSTEETRTFFTTWFSPYVIVEYPRSHSIKGIFTGYYVLLLQGSLVKTERFATPLYGLPKNLVTANLKHFAVHSPAKSRLVGRVSDHHFIPYYTRAQINAGAMRNNAPVLAWVESAFDRQLLEIEGSGIIQFPDNSRSVVGYAGDNGAPYTSIAHVLIQQGVMTKDNASSAHIRAYLKAHPKEVNGILNRNQAFVFFNKRSNGVVIGGQGVPLTPGYSLAVDLRWLPFGTPLWLNTHTKKQVPFQRLMIAQDTGGAIKGVVRGDVFWGSDAEEIAIARAMKNEGQYWVLLPKKSVYLEQKN